MSSDELVTYKNQCKCGTTVSLRLSGKVNARKGHPIRRRCSNCSSIVLLEEVRKG